MKKIINTGRTPIMVDTDTFEVSTLKRGPRAIDEIYVIPDDATIEWEKVNQHSENRTVEVKKGDIMITFYDADYATDFVIVSNADEWKAAIDKFNEAAQKRKEEWAAKQAECKDCDTPSGC